NGTMSRVGQAGPATGAQIPSLGGVATSNPGAVTAPLTIMPGGTTYVSVWLNPDTNPTYQRRVDVELWKNGTQKIGSSNATDVFTPTSSINMLRTFSIDVPTMDTAANHLAEGDYLQLRIINNSPTSTQRTLRFVQLSGDQRSTVTIPTSTVIHVEELGIFTAPYPATTQAESHGPGQTIRIRARVSDPFGYADITGGTLTIKAPGGAPVATVPVVNGTHDVASETSGAIRLYDVPYTIPAGAASGAWTASFTANEGYEETISHTANIGFTVGATVTLEKVWGA